MLVLTSFSFVMSALTSSVHHSITYLKTSAFSNLLEWRSSEKMLWSACVSYRSCEWRHRCLGRVKISINTKLKLLIWQTIRICNTCQQHGANPRTIPPPLLQQEELKNPNQISLRSDFSFEVHVYLYAKILLKF